MKCQISRRELALCLLVVGEVNTRMTAGWKEQTNHAGFQNTPTSTPTSFIHTDNKNIIRLVKAMGEEQLSVKAMMERIGLKDRENFLAYSLNPSMNGGYIHMLYPDSPRHPRQKYLLTVKGLALYNEIKADN